MNRMLMPVSACSLPHQREDLRLDRHVERRGRLVGDQQRRLAGHRQRDHHALAHAARELVRILAQALRRGRNLHQLEHAQRLRSRAAARSRPLCSRSDSAICSPMVNTGFRLVIGSWKIIAISLPRIARMRGSGRLEQIDASDRRASTNRTSPLDDASGPCAAAGASRVRLVTDLPEPDSPTTRRGRGLRRTRSSRRPRPAPGRRR